MEKNTIRKKILIIEDNTDIVELYTLYFEEKNFEVFTSFDWIKGITEILEKRPDIVLLDIMMPQMNGFEVLEVITKQSSIEIPIVVCSNLSQESDIRKAISLGAKTYITKSDFEISEIVETTIKVLQDFYKES